MNPFSTRTFRTPRRSAFVSPLGKGRLTSNVHFYDLHTSSYKVIYFLSNIYKWTLTLLTVESFSAVVAYILCGQPVCYAKDDGKNVKTLIEHWSL